MGKGRGSTSHPQAVCREAVGRQQQAMHTRPPHLAVLVRQPGAAHEPGQGGQHQQAAQHAGQDDHVVVHHLLLGGQHRGRGRLRGAAGEGHDSGGETVGATQAGGTWPAGNPCCTTLWRAGTSMHAAAAHRRWGGCGGRGGARLPGLARRRRRRQQQGGRQRGHHQRRQLQRRGCGGGHRAGRGGHQHRAGRGRHRAAHDDNRRHHHCRPGAQEQVWGWCCLLAGLQLWAHPLVAPLRHRSHAPGKVGGEATWPTAGASVQLASRAAPVGTPARYGPRYASLKLPASFWAAHSSACVSCALPVCGQQRRSGGGWELGGGSTHWSCMQRATRVHRPHPPAQSGGAGAPQTRGSACCGGGGRAGASSR